MRSFTVGSYTILCFPVESGVEIHRVLHGMRDMVRVLRNEEP
jgi:plasmid stabilization system protein ParE